MKLDGRGVVKILEFGSGDCEVILSQISRRGSAEKRRELNATCRQSAELDGEE